MLLPKGADDAAFRGASVWYGYVVRYGTTARGVSGSAISRGRSIASRAPNSRE